MQKIKTNKIRTQAIYPAIFLFIELIFLLLKKTPQLSDLFIMAFVSIFLLIIELLIEQRNVGIYYSREKIIVKKDTRTFEIPWDEAIVDDSHYRYWLLGLTKLTLKSKTHPEVQEQIDLDWFHELSALPIISDCAPRNHKLYSIAAKYAKNRGKNL